MFDLEAALEEFDRWGTGSHQTDARPPDFTVYRLANSGWRLMGVYPTATEAYDSMHRNRLDASIKAALGRSQEEAA